MKTMELFYNRFIFATFMIISADSKRALVMQYISGSRQHFYPHFYSFLFFFLFPTYITSLCSSEMQHVPFVFNICSIKGLIIYNINNSIYFMKLFLARCASASEVYEQKLRYSRGEKKNSCFYIGKRSGQKYHQKTLYRLILAYVGIVSMPKQNHRIKGQISRVHKN